LAGSEKGHWKVRKRSDGFARELRIASDVEDQPSWSDFQSGRLWIRARRVVR